jgi:hypothetical protein
LIRAAAVLGPRRLPAPVVAQWAATVQAHYDLNYGADDFVLVTTPAWRLQSSEMSLFVRNDSSRQSTIALMPGKSEVRFGRIGEIGHPFYASSNPPSATLLVRFPDAPLVRLRLQPGPEPPKNTSSSSFSSVVEMLTPTSFTGRQQALQLAAVEIGEEQFAVAARLNGADTTPTDDASAATSPPTPNAAAPAKTEASQPTAASPGTTQDATTQPATRSIAFPPIPVLTMPRFTSVHTTNTGPTLPDPQAPLDGPRFE